MESLRVLLNILQYVLGSLLSPASWLRKKIHSNLTTRPAIGLFFLNMESVRRTDFTSMRDNAARTATSLRAL